MQIYGMEKVKESYYIGYIFEAFYYIVTDYRFGYVGGAIYAFIFLLMVQTTWLFGVLFYGICYNVTYNEMWNQVDLEYLFDTVETEDGYKIKIYNNKISTGSVC